MIPHPNPPPHSDSPTQLSISLLGGDAVLCDVPGEAFSDAVQARIWGLAAAISAQTWAREAVPGMNNLMVVFDPDRTTPEQVGERVRDAWRTAAAMPGTGRLVEAATIYGGEMGHDLAELAQRAGLSVIEAARLHAAQTYSVAAVGAMPGFVYLSGLHPDLAAPRLASPRASVAAGSVIIGGAQTGIMPCTAPSGWRSIGATTLQLFDPQKSEPALLWPGDQVRFQIVDVIT